MSNVKIISAHEGFQDNFVRSNVDVAIGGGVLNCGKTSGAVLACGEPSLDPEWRAVFLRNNLGDLRSGGGILDEFKSMYRGGVSVVESGEPHVDFPSGARVDVTHIADQTRDKVRQRFKGRQYDLIYFDEMTGFSWECFTEVCTRNRGKGKWTGKIRGTTNPDRNHWLRIFLDWYIGIDGFIREDRNGRVRYFYVNGETVRDVVWGDSKSEVYQKCKISIDTQSRAAGCAPYDLIRSFTFYLGKMSENISSIGNNKGYAGAVAMTGGRSAAQLLEGNWNVSPDDDLEACITSSVARAVVTNDIQINGDKWITCDLADVGTDNSVFLYWNGFHIEDIKILTNSTARKNAEAILMFAAEHDVPDNHIIYDGIGGRYMRDYIPYAQEYYSTSAAKGMYGRGFMRLKDVCYMRFVNMMNRNAISMSEEVANRRYAHQHLKSNTTVLNEFMEECQVVRFKDAISGKKTLYSKKDMNATLGKDRSMDLVDPCAMRMMPVLDLVYGDELDKGFYHEDDEYESVSQFGSIWDNSTWF